MKKSILILLTSIIFLDCYAQNHTIVNTPAAAIVKVRDWMQNIFIFPPDYWVNGDNKADEIIRQIGIVEFELAKRFSKSDNIPCEFLIFCETRDGKPKKNIDTLRQKFGRLKVYNIASFTHVNRAGERYEMALLRCPYNENKRWDNAIKWDTIYFVLPKEEIIQ